MLEQSVLKSVQNYLAAVTANGIVVERGVVFGSQASGHVQAWGDRPLGRLFAV